MSETVTLALEGDVTLDGFARAVDGWRKLIDALSKEHAKGASIEWTVEGLEVGSALATIRGESRIPAAVEEVAAAYLSIGRAESQRATIPYAAPVRRALDQITHVLNGKIQAIRFETAEGEATIQSPDAKAGFGLQPTTAYGAVSGRVQALSNRGSLHFTLYDLLYDKAVSCYLESGREETMRELWGRLATVEGWVARDAITGRPLTVRRIQGVYPRPEIVPGSFREAAGVLPSDPEGELPEASIRRLRNAW